MYCFSPQPNTCQQKASATQRTLTLTMLLSMLVGLCLPCCCPAPFTPAGAAAAAAVPGRCITAAPPAGKLSVAAAAAFAGSDSSEPVTTFGPSANTCTVPLSLLTASQSQCLEKAMLWMCAGSVPRRSS
jgi:hypothetical protein